MLLAKVYVPEITAVAPAARFETVLVVVVAKLVA
jgi:hypothetical protein